MYTFTEVELNRNQPMGVVPQGKSCGQGIGLVATYSNSNNSRALGVCMVFREIL